MKALEMKKQPVVSRWRGRVLGLVCVLGLLVPLVGCEASAKDKMREANAALLGGDPDRAEAALGEALKKDAKLPNAAMLQGRIYMAKKQFEKAEQEFLKIWESNNLGQKDKLSVEQKRQKRILEDELWPELYLAWAKSLDWKQNAQKYDEILNKGLKYEPKNNRMNTLLVDFYEQQAERLIEQNKKLEASQMLLKINDLRTSSSRRRAAQTRAEKLQQEIFLETTKQRFETKLLPKLKEASMWDEDNKAVLFVSSAELDRRLKEEEWKPKGRAALRPLLDRFIREVSGFGPEVVIPQSATPTGFKVEEETFKRGKYAVKVSVPVQSVYLYALKVKEFNESKAKKSSDSKKPGEKKAPEKQEGAAPQDKGEAVEKKEEVKKKAE